MSYWTVVRTHPNCEKIAIKNLQNQDFGYYQPLLLEKKIRRHKLTAIESPLFPCYLFVQVTDKWACLHSTHGVAALIMTGQQPAKVSDNVISSLRSREQNGFIALPRQRPKVGDTVTIQTGPFALQKALVQRMPAKERQKILLALLSGQIKVLVDEQDLAA